MGLMELRRMMMESGPHEILQYEIEGPADIATFESNWAMPMRSLKVGINPVQDLHGYENPWPAGGGKNLFDIEKWFSDNNVDYTKTGNSYSPTLKAALYSSPFYFSDEDVTVSISAKSITDGSSINARVYLVDKNGNAVQNSTINSGTLKRENLVAAGVRFDWNSAGTVTLEAPQIELGSTATSYAPYSNICPITGWTGVNVQRTGKNLLDVTQFAKLPATTINSVDAQTGSITFTVAAILYGVQIDIPVQKIAGMTAYFSAIWPSDPKRVEFRFFDLNGSAIGNGFSTDVNRSVNIPQNAVTMSITLSNARIVDTPIEFKNLQLELGSTATAYEPYAGNLYPISWETEAGTVYGGTLDVVSGELVVDRASVDLGTLDWVYRGEFATGLFSVTSNLFEYKFAHNTRSISSKYQYYGTNNGVATAAAVLSDKMYSFYYLQNQSGRGIYVKDASYSDATAFKSAMSGVQLVYELATPITYHLTPTEVRTLLGQNNVWADTGQVEVQYWVKD